MTTKTAYAYAPITKTVMDDDGFLHVYGQVSGPQLDMDLQICDPVWLKSALPEWFETGANIRAMHQPIAAGVGTELDQVGDDHWLTGKVVDADSITKTVEGVYQGFSIGIKRPVIVKDAAAPCGRIIGGTIVEVSLVDRPSNSSSKIVLAKAVGADLVKVGEMDPSTGEVVDGEPVDEEEIEEDWLEVARHALACWLASEAAEVPEGKGSAYVVRIIAGLIQDLSWAAESDAYDDVEAASAAMKAAALNPAPAPQEDPEVITLSTVADLVKAATADAAGDDDKTAVVELRKALGLDDISTALTQAATAEDLTKVAARLAKVEETVVTSGPFRAAPPADNHRANARDELLTKAAGFRRIASGLTDQAMAAGYRQLADQTEAAANQL